MRLEQDRQLSSINSVSIQYVSTAKSFRCGFRVEKDIKSHWEHLHVLCLRDAERNNLPDEIVAIKLQQ